MTNRQFKNSINSEIKYTEYFFEQRIMYVKEEGLNTVLTFLHTITEDQKNWLNMRFKVGVVIDKNKCSVNTPNQKTI